MIFMNNRKRMIARVYHKNPILLTCDNLLLPDFVIKEVMANIREHLLEVSNALSRMGMAAADAIKALDWRKYHD